MTKKILVPTDFSENAETALKYAFGFARYIGAEEIHLLNATSIPLNPGDTLVPVTSMLFDDSQAFLKELHQKISGWPEAEGFTIITSSKIEDAVTAIREYSAEIGADYVVMGTKGAEGIEETLFGTTSASTLENVTTPTIVVPGKTAFKKPATIVFAADLKSIPDPSVLQPLKNLAIAFQSRLTLLHISDEVHLTEQEAAQKQRLNDFFHGLELQFALLHSHSIYTGVEIYIQDNQPDMVAVLSRKHNFFEKIFRSSVSRKIAYRTFVPLLSMKEQ